MSAAPTRSASKVCGTRKIGRNGAVTQESNGNGIKTAPSSPKKAIVTALWCCCLDLRFLRPARYSRQGGPSAAVRAGRGGGVSPARSCLCLEKPAVLNKIRTSRVCRWGSEQQRKSAHFDGIKIAQKRGHGPHAAYYLHRRAQGRRAPRAHETPVQSAASPMRLRNGAIPLHKIWL